MANKTDFTTGEWGQIMGGVLLAGLAVTSAQPSGLWGMLKEGLASGKALLEASSDADVNELVRAVASDFQTSEGRAGARENVRGIIGDTTKPAEVEAKAIAALRGMAATVDAKAPGDAAGFKAWVQMLGQRTAEASSEGGFLGLFGGVDVTPAEQDALDQIAAALSGKGEVVPGASAA